MAQQTTSRTLRRQVYDLLEEGPAAHRGAYVVGRALVALIVVNVAVAVLDSVPALEARYRGLFDAVEWSSLTIFSVEYALRIWTAPEHAAHEHRTPRGARLTYMLSAAGLVDLVAVLPFWFAFFLPSELRVLVVLRVVRLLKLTRYSPAMRSLLEALNAERRALFGCFVILLGTTIIAATVMHLAERHAQPDKFGTIVDAMWWAIVTLGTIGYGDLVPITPLGRTIAALTIFLSLIMIALPVGIIATAFSDEIHRRDFIVTWGMVARVPLFAGLSAAEIADILRLLRARTVEAGDIVVRRGEEAHSMYFVCGGEVEIRLEQPVRLGVGHFFGEIAVLRQTRRSATVIAKTRTNLLELDAHDLRALMQREPRIADRVHETARRRMRDSRRDEVGDLAPEEISETLPDA